MQVLVRVVSVAYLLFLTLLLLTADPARMIGCDRVLPAWLRAVLPGAHLLSFLGLGVLVFVGKWSAPRWALVLLLSAYGGLTEAVQGFVSRSPEWGDWFQDVAGVLIAAGLCWWIELLAAARSEKRRLKREQLRGAT
ncbi:MAG: VanZ family protein [Thermoguttaceae bacterium]